MLSPPTSISHFPAVVKILAPFGAAVLATSCFSGLRQLAFQLSYLVLITQPKLGHQGISFLLFPIRIDVLKKTFVAPFFLSISLTLCLYLLRKLQYLWFPRLQGQRLCLQFLCSIWRIVKIEILLKKFSGDISILKKLEFVFILYSPRIHCKNSSTNALRNESEKIKPRRPLLTLKKESKRTSRLKSKRKRAPDRNECHKLNATKISQMFHYI